MSNPKDRNESAKDDLFIEKAGTLFKESADSLDGQAQSRLNRSRQAALAELDSGAVAVNRWTQWAPAAGAAAVAVVAVVMMSSNPRMEPTISPGAAQPVGDFELLMADDSFDMLQDLEFYSWIDIDAELESDLETGADVG
jgi:hypothetical protein